MNLTLYKINDATLTWTAEGNWVFAMLNAGLFSSKEISPLASPQAPEVH